MCWQVFSFYNILFSLFTIFLYFNFKFDLSSLSEIPFDEFIWKDKILKKKKTEVDNASYLCSNQI